MRIRWRGLELPSRVACLRDKLTDSFGEFHVEPFEPPRFGHTVGNSLRRILLSSLEGSAVTTIKIQGVQHEFSSIPGMVEDITDLVLNLKLLVVKNHSEQSRTIRIERDRRGVVTGADIIHDESIEIINPDHILCTLTDDVPFVVDMTVENGRGSRTAAEGHTDDLEVGGIPIDAMFSPVRRVEYTVENTRVGQRTNYDKLVMKLWTTGTLGPEMALVEAAKILRKHLNPFVQYHEPGPGLPADGAAAERYGDAHIDAELEPQAQHEPRRAGAVGAGHELPGVRGHHHGPRPGEQVRGAAPDRPQLRRDHPQGGQGEAQRDQPRPRHERRRELRTRTPHPNPLPQGERGSNKSLPPRGGG